MATEPDNDPTVGLTEDEILTVLYRHGRDFGAEWREIDHTREPLPPVPYLNGNWPGDRLISLKSCEKCYPPQDFVLIVDEVVDKPYNYSIVPFWRKK